MRFVSTVAVSSIFVSLIFVFTGSAALAAPSDAADALDIPGDSLRSRESAGSSGGILVESSPFGTFPRSGEDYLILSTGNASEVVGGSPDQFISTIHGNSLSADGNDLTQVSFELRPPENATCLAFDFQFLSEEYPEFVGTGYNDIFTAELNESYFTMEESQVISPNNFAYDSGGNFISINTVLGMSEATGTMMNGTTEPLVAVSPIEVDFESGLTNLILTVQDIGDSIYDSAVLVDNFRWLYGANCDRIVAPLTDSDGDGLPDEWENNGIDYDGDGIIEVDLPGLGADPNRADIFLEIDWMIKPEKCNWLYCWGGISFAPQQLAIDDVITAFADAPYKNPDGSTGITLHVNVDEAISWQEASLDKVNNSYDWTRFEAIKEQNFDPLLRDVFHYAVFADRVFAESGSSGASRGIPSADFIVTDGPAAWRGGFTRIQERGTLMHELGHNLGLWHGGPDAYMYHEDPIYKSVMNYKYQMSGAGPNNLLDYSSGSPYNDWANIIFNGGSIGDLGESVPVMLTQADDEMTVDEIVPIPGDGSVLFEGPTVLATERADQELFVTIVNEAAVDTEYTVSIGTSTGDTIGSATAQVAGESESLIPVPVNTFGMNLGDLELEVVLESKTLDDVTATTLATVTVIDLDDAAVVAEGREALGQLKSIDHTMPDQVVAALDEMFDSEADLDPTVSPTQTAEPTQPAETDDETPPAQPEPSSEETPAAQTPAPSQSAEPGASQVPTDSADRTDSDSAGELSRTGADLSGMTLVLVLLLIVAGGSLFVRGRRLGND